MSRRVLKFVVKPGATGIATADEPTFLHVDWQGDDLCVWVEAEVGTGVTTRLGAVMTGQYPPDNAVHVGSANGIVEGQRIVAHVYRWTGEPT